MPSRADWAQQLITQSHIRQVDKDRTHEEIRAHSSIDHIRWRIFTRLSDGVQDSFCVLTHCDDEQSKH